MAKTKNIIYISLFLLLILILWAGLFFLSGPSTRQLPSVEDSYDFSGVDFDHAIYITAPCWESWPEKLYAPEMLKEAEASVPQDTLDYNKIQYATHRLRLTLPPGEVYGISLYSTDYSMRLYIDGVETVVVGHPGTTREETVPQMRDGVYYFQPAGETTEVVVHSANFVHEIGCRPPVLTIGTADCITVHTQNQNLKTGVVFGCLMTACLYHLAIFLMDRRRRDSLIFSVLCLLLAYTSKDFPALLFLEYDWLVAVRLEYLACILAADALALLVHTLFPTALHKWILYTYLITSIVYGGIVLTFDSTFFSRLLPVFQVISSIMIIYGFVRLAMTLRQKKLQNFLAFLGILLLGVSVLIDFVKNSPISAIGYSGVISAGMMFLVFCYTIVLSVEDTFIRRKLDEVSQNEREIRETNRILERLNRTKTDFMSNISHEMKTPLAVISNCAGITLQQLRRNALTEETEQNLDDMQHEAIRLGKLVEQLLAVAMEKERQLTLIITDAATLLRRAADFCAPICREQENQIAIETGPERILLRVNADSVFQVLLNLITNANRHMHGGTITLSVRAEENENMAVFQVEDQGSGIPPELLERVFERGISGDGGSGLGLFICEEIVREHGGVVGIESGAGGTTVQFTLPCDKGGYNHRQNNFNDRG